MSFNIEVRKKQLQSLDQYISASRNRVLKILSQLSWNPKQVLDVHIDIFGIKQYFM